MIWQGCQDYRSRKNKTNIAKKGSTLPETFLNCFKKSGLLLCWVPPRPKDLCSQAKVIKKIRRCLEEHFPPFRSRCNTQIKMNLLFSITLRDNPHIILYNKRLHYLLNKFLNTLHNMFVELHSLYGRFCY